MSEAHVGPGAVMPAPDDGPPFTSTRITSIFAGNEVMARDDGGTIREVAEVQSIVRLVWKPMEGHPDYQDHNLARVTDVHAFSRRGHPATTWHRARQPVRGDT